MKDVINSNSVGDTRRDFIKINGVLIAFLEGVVGVEWLI